MTRRHCVLFFPAWSVVAATWDESLPEVIPGAAVAILENSLVRECSAAAAAAGVRVGMKRREAHSACPEVVLVPHNPHRDARVFDRIRVWISHWVAQHTLVEPGVLAFQAKGLARFYGGEEAAGRFLIDAARSHLPPLESRVGVADDLFSAVIAARKLSRENPVCCIPVGCSAAFLAQQPVSILEHHPTVSLLLRLGIKSVAAFVALGESAIRERFGVVGERLYRLATGVENTPLPLSTTPIDPVQRIDLPEPYTLVDQVAFGIRAGTQEYADRLMAAGYVCTRVRIHIAFDNNQEHQRVWVHPRFFSAGELVDRLRWQLEQCLREDSQTLEYSPGVISVTYYALEPENRDAHEPGLWGSGPDARVHQVFSRVQSLVGAQGVLTATTQVSRLPQDSHILSVWGEKSLHEKHARTLPGALPKPLPATVFTIPSTVQLVNSEGQDVLVTQGTLCATPVQMLWRSRSIQLQSWAGPWPVRESWWRPESNLCVYRLQVLDERGVGWLLVAGEGLPWQLVARYD